MSSKRPHDMLAGPGGRHGACRWRDRCDGACAGLVCDGSRWIDGGLRDVVRASQMRYILLCQVCATGSVKLEGDQEVRLIAGPVKRIGQPGLIVQGCVTKKLIELLCNGSLSFSESVRIT